MKTDTQKLTEANKEKEKQLKSEQFCVEIKLPSQPHILRLTYTNPRNGILAQVDEINDLNELISSATVKGRVIKGDLPDVIKDLIPIFRIKPTDWIDHNSSLYWDSYYKNH